VVLANSLGTTLAMWDPQLSLLKRRFRVVRYDLPGHGGSAAPHGPYTIAGLGAQLVALLDELGVGRAHLCGLSIGGMIAMWVASHAPERVDRLVLCATSALLGPADAWASRAETVLASGMRSVSDAVVGRWFTPGFAERNPAVVSRMRAMLETASPVGYAGCCRAIERMDLRPDLGRIVAPTLVVAGADDPAIPADHAERIAAGIAGSRLEVVGPAAHLVNIEQPDRVGRLIGDHLAAEGEA
jgi:3-oxoadipate enol-lactonase